MGVRGLLSYMSRHCPDACYKASVADLISDETRRTGCRPTIVVDAPSCFSTWYHGLDWTIGLQVQELIHRLRLFVESFNEMGADLVFFFGGLTPFKKRTTWLNRRATNLRQMMMACNMLYAGKTFEEISKKMNLNSIPLNMGNFVAFVLKHVLDCKVFVSIRDCDDEVINYVKENDCFAIFAHDSDFIVSQLKCLVLDGHLYNCEKKTTLVYNRYKLCRYLNIKKSQLPLLAILAGNDYIDFETLRPFHYEICNWSSRKLPHIPYRILMECIADYLNNLPQRFSKELMVRICEDVFNDRRYVDDMIRAFYAYIPRPTEEFIVDDQWARILRAAKERLVNVLLTPSAWSVLTKQIYESSVCLEDMRAVNDSNEDDKLLPSATLTRSLRKRFYGILLYENRSSNPIVREWCAENVESYQESVKVAPEYPKVHHPGLRALWNEDRNEMHYLDKWKLFLEAVSPSIKGYVDEWMAIPDDLVVGTATCYYLYHEKDFLNSKEKKAILITLVMFPHYCRSDLKETKTIFQPSMRAKQIIVTFSRTFSLMFSLMASCGYPVPLSKDTAHTKFEPQLFQIMYERVTETRFSQKTLCDYNLEALNTYRQLEALMHR